MGGQNGCGGGHSTYLVQLVQLGPKLQVLISLACRYLETAGMLFLMAMACATVFDHC